MQGHPDDFLAISFVYALGAGGSRTLVDCTAFGNDAEWDAVPGTTYLIMEAGLSTAVTEEPDFSDKGGHGSIRIDRARTERRQALRWSRLVHLRRLRVPGQRRRRTAAGCSTLRKGTHGDPTPYSSTTTSRTSSRPTRPTGSGSARTAGPVPRPQDHERRGHDLHLQCARRRPAVHADRHGREPASSSTAAASSTSSPSTPRATTTCRTTSSSRARTRSSPITAGIRASTSRTGARRWSSRSWATDAPIHDGRHRGA